MTDKQKCYIRSLPISFASFHFFTPHFKPQRIYNTNSNMLKARLRQGRTM